LNFAGTLESENILFKAKPIYSIICNDPKAVGFPKIVVLPIDNYSKLLISYGVGPKILLVSVNMSKKEEPIIKNYKIEGNLFAISGIVNDSEVRIAYLTEKGFYSLKNGQIEGFYSNSTLNGLLLLPNSIMVSTTDGKIGIIQDEKLIQTLLFPSYVSVMELSADYSSIALGFVDGSVRILDSISYSVTKELKFGFGMVKAIAWGPKSSKLYISGQDDLVYVENTTTLAGHTSFVSSISVISLPGSQKEFILTLAEDSMYTIWDTKEKTTSFILDNTIRCIKSISNVTVIVYPNLDIKVYYWKKQ